ncbi:unnamed protein product [Cuscuta campestris]|uniref:Pectinesterase n=1 Tax=Cuscuta campestris TaxID=132261 RepID=A0A484K915_9ASTE|nr:unnamed protein product [Cuscuta campestris]
MSAAADLAAGSGRRHRRRKGRCDASKWDSGLVSAYNVSRVMTVDTNGCGNFSSVQAAIDAVPDPNPDVTLIIIDSGTYRSTCHQPPLVPLQLSDAMLQPVSVSFESCL